MAHLLFFQLKNLIFLFATTTCSTHNFQEFASLTFHVFGYLWIAEIIPDAIINDWILGAFMVGRGYNGSFEARMSCIHVT